MTQFGAALNLRLNLQCMIAFGIGGKFSNIGGRKRPNHSAALDHADDSLTLDMSLRCQFDKSK